MFFRWFKYIGDKDTPFVPFQINYDETFPDDMIPPDVFILPCNESYEVSKNWPTLILKHQCVFPSYNLLNKYNFISIR